MNEYALRKILMKFVLFLSLTLSFHLTASEMSPRTNNVIRSEYKKFSAKIFKKSVKKFGEYRNNRKEFIEFLEKLEISDENKELIDIYIKRNPQFTFPKARFNGKRITLIHRNNKLTISMSDYAQGFFYLNSSKINFELEDNFERQFSQFKGKFRKRGIPLIIKIFNALDMNAYADSQLLKSPIFEVGFSFYTLLHIIRQNQLVEVKEFLDEFNSRLDLKNADCLDKKSTQPISPDDFSFLKKEESFIDDMMNALDKTDINFVSVSEESCAYDMSFLYKGNKSQNKEEKSMIKVICGKLNILNKCFESKETPSNFNHPIDHHGKENSLDNLSAPKKGNVNEE